MISDENLASLIQLEAGVIPFIASHPGIAMDERQLELYITSDTNLSASLAAARARDGEADSEAYISARLRAHTLRLVDAGDQEMVRLLQSAAASGRARAAPGPKTPRIGR